MLVSYKDLKSFAVRATDNRKGHVEDFYFDDESWRIRYLVIEFGFLFAKSQSLVGSSLLGLPDVDARTFSVALTKDQIEEAEPPGAHPPVSEQQELALKRREAKHWPMLLYGYPGAVYTPQIAETQLFGGPPSERRLETAPEAPHDPHLRSMAEVSGYKIEANDGDIGTVDDFLVDPDGWVVSYLVADTGNWLPGRQVVVKLDWVAGIRWADRRIEVDAPKRKIEEAPELSAVEELERSQSPLAVAPYGAYGAFPS